MLDRTPNGRDLSAFVRKLSHVVTLGREQVDALEALPAQTRKFRRGDTIMRPGDRLNVRAIITSGWITRCLFLHEGSRQILGFGLPGDFLAGHAGDRHFAFYSAIAAERTEILYIEEGALEFLGRRDAVIAEALDWITDREFAGLARTVERIGRRPARSRLAHFLLELSYRLWLIGHPQHEALKLPLRQQDIADACGLSLVHVNKTLRAYQKEGLLLYRRGSVELLDPDGLTRLTGLSYESFLQTS